MPRTTSSVEHRKPRRHLTEPQHNEQRDQIRSAAKGTPPTDAPCDGRAVARLSTQYTATAAKVETLSPRDASRAPVRAAAGHGGRRQRCDRGSGPTAT